MSLRPVVRPARRLLLAAAIALLLTTSASGTVIFDDYDPTLPAQFATANIVPDISKIPADSQRIRPLLERYQADLGSLDQLPRIAAVAGDVQGRFAVESLPAQRCGGFDHRLDGVTVQT